MTVLAAAVPPLRAATALLLCMALVTGGAPALFAQSSTATVAGVILDPVGRPTEGFKVILRDVASNKEFLSGPTDAEGNYTAEVPVGGRYKLAAVVADDGVTKLAVQDVPPVNVLTPGTTRLNVRFTTDPAPAAPVVAPAPGTDEKKSKPKSAVPWYKRPGPITGMVLGGVAIVALAAGGGGGGGSDTASASLPTDK